MSTPSILSGTSYTQQYANITYPTSATTSTIPITGVSYPATTISTTTDTYYMNTPKNVLTVDNSGKIVLKGDDADVMIGDKSLKKTLEAIERHLNIITLRPDLEERWSKLTAAREHYEQCLADVIEKETIWRELKR